LQVVEINGEIITFSSILGAFAIFFAAINIFGGFYVTQRMLEMFKKKEKKEEAKNAK
jgi:NAD(P) transhydrogenase subunit alpha